MEINHKYNLLLLATAGINKNRSLIKNIAVILTRIGFGIFLKPKKLLRDLDMACMKYDFDSCSWSGNLLGAWRLKEVMPTKIMGVPQKYVFEDMMIYGVEDYDSYLTNLYGNWRELPPIEKRVTHHNFIECDLEKSYLDY